MSHGSTKGSDPGNPFAAFGGQMMQAWSGALDAWWSGLLADQQRLASLADKLRPFGAPGAPQATPAVRPEDIAAVLQALELVEQRLDRLDAQVQVLAEGMTSLVDHIEAGRGDAPKDEA